MQTSCFVTGCSIPCADDAGPSSSRCARGARPTSHHGGIKSRRCSASKWITCHCGPSRSSTRCKRVTFAISTNRLPIDFRQITQVTESAWVKALPTSLSLWPRFNLRVGRNRTDGSLSLPDCLLYILTWGTLSTHPDGSPPPDGLLSKYSHGYSEYSHPWMGPHQHPCCPSPPFARPLRICLHTCTQHTAQEHTAGHARWAGCRWIRTF